MTPLTKRVYRFLVQAACENRAIMGVDIETGAKIKRGGVSRVVKRLERSGHIIVERRNGKVRYHVPAINRHTDWEQYLGINGATTSRPKKAKPAEGTRECLRCHRPFKSWGKGNRFCKACKNSADWRSGEDYIVEVLV